MDFTDEVRKIMKRRAQVEKLKKARDTQREHIKRAEEAMQAAVRRGKSTGDRIFDFVLGVYGTIDVEDRHTSRLRAVEAALSGNTGKLILIWSDIVQPRTLGQYPMFSNPHAPAEISIKRFQCGVLTGEQLRITRDHRLVCTLPVEYYTDERFQVYTPRNSVLLSEVDGGKLFAVDGSILHPDFNGLRHMVNFVVVGNDNVKQWLDNETHGNLFPAIAQRLGGSIPTALQS